MRRLILLAFTADVIFSVSCTDEVSGPYHRRHMPRCNANEIYSQCPEAVCRPKSCSDVGFPVLCVDISPNGRCPGKPGCICKEGYVKNNKGICIPIDECPSCGGDPNATSGCGVHCGNRCSNYDKRPVFCPDICLYNSCDCKEGFVYDDNLKKCVKPKDCTPTCGFNEIYDSCPATCPPQRCDVDPAVILCRPNPQPGDPECKPGCRCIDNYVRNSTGNCIPKENCPPCCGPDEVASDCVNGGCGPKKCSDLGFPTKCVKPKICNKGCICKEGYLRNDDGFCVPINQCPPCCGPNEVASDCVNGGCGPKKCSDLGFPTKCVKPKICNKGCICKEGYLRNDDGFCVPINQCPSCGGDPNAELGCGVNCGRLCSNYDKGPAKCPRICNADACDCKKDYVYDENIGKCVLPEDCSPVCSTNEVYNECINAYCGAQTCSQLGITIACPAVSKCIGGCTCKEGYLRAQNGTCIPQKKCPSTCLRPHEYYDPCPNNCPPQTCESLDRVYHCPIQLASIDGTQNCNGACRCKRGYFRNLIGECITKEECRKCRGPHEYFSCGGFCDNVCETLKEQNQTNCPIATFVCVKQCYCEKDYARAANGTCIPIDSCEEPQCPINEMYVNNPETRCEPEYCTELGFPIECPLKLEPDCTDDPGCICMEGYVRNDFGACIPKIECPSCGGDPNAQAGCGANCLRCSNYQDEFLACPDICMVNGCDCKEGYIYDDYLMKCVLPEQCTLCPGPNEEYDLCPPFCPPQTCESIGKSYRCPAMTDNPDNCKPACRCKKGYLRNSIGECIAKEDCLSCNNDPNARPGCGINCNKRCSDIGKEPQMCIDLCKENACDCKDGFYLDDDTGKCVRAEDCPLSCGKNEVYNNCIQGQCGPKTCKQLGKSISCPRIDPRFCKKGCLCKDGYVRAHNGSCIPKAQCPSCGGDPNAQSGCGGNCNRRCSSYNKEPEACTLECKLNGCDCKDGFLFDDLTRRCVRPRDCSPPICGKNEVPSDCVNGGCDKRNCSQVGKPDICIDPIKCIKGCICKENYLRANNGTCVPINECRSTTNSCGNGPGINNNPKSGTSIIDGADSLAKLRRGILAMNGAFLNIIHAEDPSTSFVFSAISILIALAQLTLGAVGLTSEQLHKALNLENNDKIRTAFPKLTELFSEQKNVTLELAVKCYGNMNYQFNKDFLTDSMVVFNAEAENVDFAESQETADEINAWVANKTHDLIPSIVSPDMFDEDTIIVLINAIYFLGNWKKPFPEDNTKKKDFYITPSKTQSIDFMQQESTFDYRDNDEIKAQTLKMFYKGGNMSIVIFLPNDKDGLPDMIEKMRDPDVFARSIQSFNNQRVNVVIPKFDILTQLDLNELLPKYDITEIFNPDADGLKGILKKDRPLYVSQGLQKSIIIVDEKGTEAAAVTAITVGVTSAINPEPEIIQFNAKSRKPVD